MMKPQGAGNRAAKGGCVLAAISALIALSVATHAQTAVENLNRLTVDGDFTFTISIAEQFANTPQQMSRDGYTLELLKESADLYVKQKKMTQAQEGIGLKASSQ